MSDSRWGRVLVRDAVPSLLARFFADDVIAYTQAMNGGIWVGGKISLTKNGVSYRPAWWEKIFHTNLRPQIVKFSEILNIPIADEEKVVGTVILGLSTHDFVFQCYRANKIASSIVEATQHSHAKKAN